MMKLTLNQRRFLIIWILFHSFAYFVNIAQIEGRITIQGDSSVNNYNLLTSINTDPYEHPFWPFVTFYRDHLNDSFHSTAPNGMVSYTNFYGIFNYYSLKAYISYIIIGLALIYVPKFWKNNT